MNYCQTGSPDDFTWLVMILTLCIAVTLILGILFSPIGALICGLLAWRRLRGRKIWRYVGLGPLHSALFFLPWIYTVCRLAGWRPPRRLVTLTYITVYSLWFVGPIIGAWFLLCVGWDRDALFWRLKTQIGWLSIVQLITWLVSLIWLYNYQRGDSRLLPRLVYVQPFILLAIWTTLLTIAFAVSL